MSEKLSYAFGRIWMFESSPIVKINGTAQPSLVLDNLQETEKLEKAEREKAEEVIARALGSLDLGG